jgi:hypothetical protein
MVAACHPLIVAMKPKRTFFLKEEKQLNFGKNAEFVLNSLSFGLWISCRVLKKGAVWL